MTEHITSGTMEMVLVSTAMNKPPPLSITVINSRNHLVKFLVSQAHIAHTPNYAELVAELESGKLMLTFIEAIAVGDLKLALNEVVFCLYIGTTVVGFTDRRPELTMEEHAESFRIGTNRANQHRPDAERMSKKVNKIIDELLPEVKAADGLAKSVSTKRIEKMLNEDVEFRKDIRSARALIENHKAEKKVKEDSFLKHLELFTHGMFDMCMWIALGVTIGYAIWGKGL